MKLDNKIIPLNEWAFMIFAAVTYTAFLYMIIGGEG